jgi:glyoxylase-like metal-dependent hydrolase (beta-lactamase superfamily II)
MTEYLASLAVMRALAPRRLLPAHGPVLVDPAAAIDRYVTHRLWREARVRAALEASTEPVTATELVPTAYADVAPALYPLAERSLIAHLVKLERDGAADRAGRRWRAAAAPRA